MIDSFNIKANVAENQLLIQLRGYFMKSEIELAFYLARKESTKLEKDFIVLVDLDGMYTDKKLYDTIYSRLKKTFKALGAKNIKTIGALTKIPKSKVNDLEHFLFESVGFYPN